MPRRIDTPLLFPAARGGPIDLENPLPPVDAGGSGRGPRAPAGVRLPAHVRDVGDRRRHATVHVARVMGTSVAQIDATYGHLMPDSEEYLRGLLDAFDTRPLAAAESV